MPKLTVDGLEKRAQMPWHVVKKLLLALLLLPSLTFAKERELFPNEGYGEWFLPTSVSKYADLAKCIVARSPERAQQALDAYLDHPFRYDIEALVEQHIYCQYEGSFISPYALGMAGPLAEALMAKNRFFVRPTGQLLFGFFEGKDGAKRLPEFQFANCVVLTAPETTRNVFKTRFQSKAERDALGLVLDEAVSCNASVFRSRLPMTGFRSRLRAMLSISVYLGAEGQRVKTSSALNRPYLINLRLVHA